MLKRARLTGAFSEKTKKTKNPSKRPAAGGWGFQVSEEWTEYAASPSKMERAARPSADAAQRYSVSVRALLLEPASGRRSPLFFISFRPLLLSLCFIAYPFAPTSPPPF
jgi:hypothetical protein